MVRAVLRLLRQATFAGLGERDEVADLGGLSELGFDPGEGVGGGQAGTEEDLVGLGELADGVGGSPARSSPTLLMKRVSAGLPSAIMNGATSWTTLEHPPTMAWRPMRQNWWTAARPPMTTWSSTVT